MVVFAVSMIVAVTLIHFSRTAIMDAKNNLAGFQNKDTLKENFVEIDTATAKQIVFLAEECYDRYESTLDRKICFSVKINNPFDATAAISDIKAEWTGQGNDLINLNTTKLTGIINAIFIYYNPMNIVEITQ